MILNVDFILQNNYDARKLLLVTYFDKAVKRKTCLKWITEELAFVAKSGTGRSTDVIRQNLIVLQTDGVLTIEGDLSKRNTNALVVSINEKHPPFFSSQDKKSFPEKKKKIKINFGEINKYQMKDYFQWNKKSFNVIFV